MDVKVLYFRGKIWLWTGIL